MLGLIRIIKMKKILLFVSLIFISYGVNAGCRCVCMGGQNQPVCSNSLDLPPICPPRVCPIEPPSIAPIQSPRVPPIGTKTCTQKQVYDDYSGTYKWKEICY